NHARLDDRLLQLVEFAVEVARDLGQLVRGQPGLLQRLALMQRARERIELRLFDDQFADDVHDVIEFADVDANGLRDRAQRLFFLRLHFRGDRPRFYLSQRRHLPLGYKRADGIHVEHRSVQEPEGNAGTAAAVDGRKRGDDL